jgi:hypothetical protein
VRRVLWLAPFLVGCPLALPDFSIEDASIDVADPPDVAVDTLALDAADASPPAQWSPIAAAPGGAREKAAACAFADGRVLVWGGADASGKALATGAIYDATKDSWITVATANAPSARVLASAVCVGTKAVVWGGGDPASTADYKDGAVYDAATDSWSPMPPPPGALPGARASYGERAGNVAVFWCGLLKSGAAANGPGASYDPSSSQWAGLGGGGPQTLLDPAVAATSTQYVVFGGQAGPADQNDLFTLQGTVWTKSAAPGAPSARHGAFAAFDGSVFVAWGGAPALQSGGAFTLPSGPWRPTTTTGAPSARAAIDARTGWAFSIASGKTAILAGVLASSAIAHDGAIYDSSSDAWTAIPAWTAAEDHEWGVAAWTGSAIVVWGGRTGAQVTATGERFTPP